MKTVYLSGPITGLTYGESTDWRAYATADLSAVGLKAISPMRGKEYLAQLNGPISGHGRDYVSLSVLSTPPAVVTRDRFDTTRCDVVLMNLLGAKAISIGTMVELGWADAARRPIIAAVEPEGNAHDHMFVNQLIGYRCATLDEALHMVKAILL